MPRQFWRLVLEVCMQRNVMQGAGPHLRSALPASRLSAFVFRWWQPNSPYVRGLWLDAFTFVMPIMKVIGFMRGHINSLAGEIINKDVTRNLRSGGIWRKAIGRMYRNRGTSENQKTLKFSAIATPHSVAVTTTTSTVTTTLASHRRYNHRGSHIRNRCCYSPYTSAECT